EGASASTSTSGLPRTGRIEVTSAGYAVTLPANWFRIDFSKEDVEAFSKAGSGNLGPGVSDQLAAQVASLAAANISLYAFRFADADAVIGTNLNIIVLPSLGLDLATLETLNVQQLQQLVGKDVKIAHTRVTLPAGEALRLSYSIPAGGPPSASPIRRAPPGASPARSVRRRAAERRSSSPVAARASTPPSPRSRS